MDFLDMDEVNAGVLIGEETVVVVVLVVAEHIIIVVVDSVQNVAKKIQHIVHIASPVAVPNTVEKTVLTSKKTRLGCT